MARERATPDPLAPPGAISRLSPAHRGCVRVMVGAHRPKHAPVALALRQSLLIHPNGSKMRWNLCRCLPHGICAAACHMESVPLPPKTS